MTRPLHIKHYQNTFHRRVAVKTVEQQDLQSRYRLRAAREGERTTLSSQLRSLLSEYGIVLAQGVSTLRKRQPELLEDADSGLSDILRPLLARCY